MKNQKLSFFRNSNINHNNMSHFISIYFQIKIYKMFRSINFAYLYILKLKKKYSINGESIHFPYHSDTYRPYRALFQKNLYYIYNICKKSEPICTFYDLCRIYKTLVFHKFLCYILQLFLASKLSVLRLLRCIQNQFNRIYRFDWILLTKKKKMLFYFYLHLYIKNIILFLFFIFINVSLYILLFVELILNQYNESFFYKFLRLFIKQTKPRINPKLLHTQRYFIISKATGNAFLTNTLQYQTLINYITSLYNINSVLGSIRMILYPVTYQTIKNHIIFFRVTNEILQLNKSFQRFYLESVIFLILILCKIKGIAFKEIMPLIKQDLNFTIEKNFDENKSQNQILNKKKKDKKYHSIIDFSISSEIKEEKEKQQNIEIFCCFLYLSKELKKIEKKNGISEKDFVKIFQNFFKKYKLTPPSFNNRDFKTFSQTSQMGTKKLSTHLLNQMNKDINDIHIFELVKKLYRLLDQGDVSFQLINWLVKLPYELSIFWSQESILNKLLEKDKILYSSIVSANERKKKIKELQKFRKWLDSFFRKNIVPLNETKKEKKLRILRIQFFQKKIVPSLIRLESIFFTKWKKQVESFTGNKMYSNPEILNRFRNLRNSKCFTLAIKWDESPLLSLQKKKFQNDKKNKKKELLEIYDESFIYSYPYMNTKGKKEKEEENSDFIYSIGDYKKENENSNNIKEEIDMITNFSENFYTITEEEIKIINKKKDNNFCFFNIDFLAFFQNKKLK
jgi:hypothetical protein